MVIPLQGMAAAIHGFACIPESEDASTKAAEHGRAGNHDHAAHDHGTSHQHPAGTSDSEHASHQCCHHVSSAAAARLGQAANVDLPVYLSSLTLLETLFYPEQPQRPPRG